VLETREGKKLVAECSWAIDHAVCQDWAFTHEFIIQTTELNEVESNHILEPLTIQSWNDIHQNHNDVEDLQFYRVCCTTSIISEESLIPINATSESPDPRKCHECQQWIKNTDPYLVCECHAVLHSRCFTAPVWYGTDNIIYAGDKPLVCRRKECGKQITSKPSTQIQPNTSPLVVRIFLDIGTKSIKARTEYDGKKVLFNNIDENCVKPVCSIRKTPTDGADVKFDHMFDPNNWSEINTIKRIMCGTTSELDTLDTQIKNHGFVGGSDDILLRLFQQLFKGFYKDYQNEIKDFDAVNKELAVALPSGMPFEQQTRVLTPSVNPCQTFGHLFSTKL
jgi:hypothetical protein